MLPTDIQTHLTTLESTPRRIAAATNVIESTRLHFRADESDWSANDILAHLRACADVWGKSMVAMVEQDHPTLRYVSPRTFIKKTGYLALDFQPSLLAFTAQRNALLVWLKGLSPEQWLRSASFIVNTQGRNHNVFTYAQRMAQHELVHCEQIEALFP